MSPTSSSKPPAKKKSAAPKKKAAAKKATPRKASAAPKRPSRASSPAKRKRASKRPAKKKSKGRNWFMTGLALGAATAAVGLLAAVSLFSYYGRDLPTVAALRNYAPPQVTRIVDRHGTVLSESFTERRTVVAMQRIPRVLVLSVLAAEDADFYLHRGLDYAGILGALVRGAVSDGAMHGASTITQQIIKNVLLTSERTLARKVKELILARRLEQELTKDEILGLYLNHIYFGHGRYGVQEASRFFFDKDVDDITLAEASLIAGIPQSPNRLSPIRNLKGAKRRQSYVLTQLQAKRVQYWDDLSEQEIKTARDTKVKLFGRAGVVGGAPEVIGIAKAALKEQAGEANAKTGGFTVKTTIDLNLQQAARAALKKGLMAIDKRQRFLGPLRAPKRPKPLKLVKRVRVGKTYDAMVTGAHDESGIIDLDVGGHKATARLRDLARFNPKNLSATKFAREGARVRALINVLGDASSPHEAKLVLGPQGAVVVMDVRSREVLALVGSDEANYGFNRATQAVRQPGSTFKPFVYALALENESYTPATLVLDAPEVFDEWRPNNYETWHYSGAVRLREGLARSINLVAVRVIQDVTPKAVVEFAQSMGITTDLDPSLALSLGASGVRPLELVNAYATFAAAGRYEPARMVRSIRGSDRARLKPTARPEPVQVLRQETAYVLTSMLRSVVEEGTAKKAKALGRPVGGKTGTSNRARDAWFVGYSPEIVAGVWVGFDDHRALGRRESGGGSALPIWVDVMQAALAGKPKVDFPEPSDIEHALIDPLSGNLAYDGQENAMDEVFLPGTVPTEQANPPEVLDSDTFLMEQL